MKFDCRSSIKSLSFSLTKFKVNESNFDHITRNTIYEMRISEQIFTKYDKMREFQFHKLKLGSYYNKWNPVQYLLHCLKRNISSASISQKLFTTSWFARYATIYICFGTRESIFRNRNRFWRDYLCFKVFSSGWCIRDMQELSGSLLLTKIHFERSK